MVTIRTTFLKLKKCNLSHSVWLSISYNLKKKTSIASLNKINSKVLSKEEMFPVRKNLKVFNAV
jgi:hypothetical protein